MTSTDFILLLTNTESVLQKKRTRSLARAQWADVLEVDAQIELCGLLRKAVVGLEEQGVKMPEGTREASRTPHYQNTTTAWENPKP